MPFQPSETRQLPGMLPPLARRWSSGTQEPRRQAHKARRWPGGCHVVVIDITSLQPNPNLYEVQKPSTCNLRLLEAIRKDLVTDRWQTTTAVAAASSRVEIPHLKHSCIGAPESEIW